MPIFNSIIITGPTASGKTALAAQLAYALNGEIISADSRQVYKKLNIGTGKDLAEYTVNNLPVNYHLIDVAEVGTHFHLYDFITHFYDAFQAIAKQQKLPIICGGTGLYLDAIIKKHELAAIPNNFELRLQLETLNLEQLITKLLSYKNKPENADLTTEKRLIRAIEIADYLSNNDSPKTNFIDLKPIIFALDLPKEARRNKISIRLKHRLENGMIDEVKDLINEGISHERLQFLGLEYQYISKYLLNEMSYDEMLLKLETSIHQYAKRQMTWFRKMEREGNQIHWLDATKPIQENLKAIKLLI
ncbi:MAG: tRNA (adenosine(37)-N6)-dimethylallyltransferase MiaA [Bacteroidia bacterium]|nr:tRNA (adenosine(37)-N6)-dimethylallyltransferase MiaA [Bacteroidia bacterium]